MTDLFASGLASVCEVVRDDLVLEMRSCTRPRKGGAECIVSSNVGHDTGHLAARLNVMVEVGQLPAYIVNLGAALLY